LRREDGPHPRRASLASSRRDEGEWEIQGMYGYRSNVMEDRILREQDLADRVAERERYRRASQNPSQRAIRTRWLFTLAVAAKREETLRVVWGRLEARGRL
jgi:hypothetical protein